MATIWNELKRCGPAWVIPLGSAGFVALVLLFGFVFESIYYARFGVEITDHSSKAYFMSAPFRHPVTFGWAALVTFIFLVNFRLGVKTECGV